LDQLDSFKIRPFVFFFHRCSLGQIQSILQLLTFMRKFRKCDRCFIRSAQQFYAISISFIVSRHYTLAQVWKTFWWKLLGCVLVYDVYFIHFRRWNCSKKSSVRLWVLSSHAILFWSLSNDWDTSTVISCVIEIIGDRLKRVSNQVIDFLW